MLGAGTRTGVFLHDRGLTVVAMTGDHGATHFALPLEDNLGARLRAELESRHVRPGRVRIGLQRSLVTVKVLELPPVAGQDRSAMLRFALERHVPFPAEDMAFDARDLPGAKDGPARILVAAAERRVVDRAVRLVEEARLRPACVTVACHELPRLVVRARGEQRAVWAHRRGASIMLVFLSGADVCWSREVPAEGGEALADAITASLPLLRWRSCEAVWISGDGAAELIQSFPDTLAAAVSEPPWEPVAAAAVRALSEEERATGVLALAVAASRKRPALDLLPEALRPRTWTGAQIATAAMAVLAAGAVIGALSVQGYQDGRRLQALDGAARALEPQVKEVERISAELNQKRRLLASVKAAEDGSVRALPFLRELTEMLPQDAWLSSLSVDPKGVELAGQANGASQLIPLLESSGWLERAEFTSPVTRGRDREQFRLRASWEVGPAGPALAAPPASGGPGGPRGAGGARPGVLGAPQTAPAAPPAVAPPSAPPGPTPAPAAPPPVFPPGKGPG